MSNNKTNTKTPTLLRTSIIVVFVAFNGHVIQFSLQEMFFSTLIAFIAFSSWRSSTIHINHIQCLKAKIVWFAIIQFFFFPPKQEQQSTILRMSYVRRKSCHIAWPRFQTTNWYMVIGQPSHVIDDCWRRCERLTPCHVTTGCCGNRTNTKIWAKLFPSANDVCANVYKYVYMCRSFAYSEIGNTSVFIWTIFILFADAECYCAVRLILYIRFVMPP